MIDDQDLQQIFAKPEKVKRHMLKTVLGYFGFMAALFVVVFIAINFSALYNVIRYWYQTDIKLSDNNNYAPSIISSNSGSESIPKNKLPNIENNHILIPKINASAPITWAVANTDGAVQSALEKGVVQLKGTSLPGEMGNVFVTGHSSNYFWARGGYKNIFSLLSKIVVGDLIYVKYRNVLYIYKASAVKVVKPTDTSVLTSAEGSYLTLMTCAPVGTSLNRLIIKAEQIDPDPIRNTNGSKSTTGALPKGVR